MESPTLHLAIVAGIAGIFLRIQHWLKRAR